MENTRTYQITLPTGDAAFLKKQASRMGWKLKTVQAKRSADTQAKAYELAMRDKAEGHVSTYATVQELFDELGI